MDIGLRIKQLRSEKKLTQSDFSSLIAISRDSLVKIELGKQNPTIEVLSEIVKVFNSDYGWLIDGKKTVPKTVPNAVSNEENDTKSNNSGPPNVWDRLQAENELLKKEIEYKTKEIGLLNDKIQDKELIIDLLKKDAKLAELLNKTGVFDVPLPHPSSKSKSKLEETVK